MRDKLIKFSDKGLFLFLCLMLVFATFSIAGTEIAFGFALLFFIIKKITEKANWKKIIPPTKLNLPIFCFLIVCLISSIFSIEPKRSFYALIGKTLEYAAIYFLFVESIGVNPVKSAYGGAAKPLFNGVNKKRFNLVLILLFASCGLSAVDGLFQQVNGLDFLRQRPFFRGMTAAFKNSIDFGGFLILVLPLILSSFFCKKIKLIIRSFAILLLAILTGICLALSYSRGAWVGFFIGFIFLFIYIFIYLSSRRQRIYLPFLVIAVCAFIVFIAPPEMKERAISIVRMEDSSRFVLWKQCIAIFKQRPLFGQGLGIYMDMSNGTYAHNCYLQMLAEIGIVGLLSFLWIIGRLFKLVIRSFKQSKDPLLLGLFAGIIAFLVHSFFDTNLYSLQLSVLFWAMLGLTVAKTEDRRQKTENRGQKTENRRQKAVCRKQRLKNR